MASRSRAVTPSLLRADWASGHLPGFSKNLVQPSSRSKWSYPVGASSRHNRRRSTTPCGSPQRVNRGGHTTSSRRPGASRRESPPWSCCTAGRSRRQSRRRVMGSCPSRAPGAPCWSIRPGGASRGTRARAAGRHMARLDDVAFVDALVHKLEADAAVAPSRVDLVGYSNGRAAHRDVGRVRGRHTGRTRNLCGCVPRWPAGDASTPPASSVIWRFLAH